MLPAPILRLRGATLPGPRYLHHGPDSGAGFVVGIDAEAGELAFQIFALLLDLCAQRVLKIGDVVAQLCDIHFRYGGAQRRKPGFVLAAWRTTTPLCLVRHEFLA